MTPPLKSELILVRMTPAEAQMLEQITKDGGFTDRDECARSIICAVLEDDAIAHMARTNVVAVDFAAQNKRKP